MAKELNELELEELEARRLQNELARAQLEQLRAETETKRNNKRRGAEDARKAMEDRMAIQQVCNHHVGGKGAFAVSHGQGDLKRPTSVSALQLLNGTFIVTCLRCFKKWRSDIPNGNPEIGIGQWIEGAALWQDSQNTEIGVVGGLVMGKKQELPVG